MKRERRERRAAWDRRADRGAGRGEDGAVQGDSGAELQLPWEPEEQRQSPGIGRTLSTGYCRLCHGKFSSRSLRHAFGKVAVTGKSSEKQKRLDQVFFADFQQLVGVAVRQNPDLPQFVCKDCHAQFYKCRSVLRTFIQRVNTSPTDPQRSRAGNMHSAVGATTDPCSDLITSSPECLHSLVSWTHSHAGRCPSVPSLQRVLSSQYCGIIRAVWGCGGGHDYIMDTDSDCSAPATQQEKSAPEVPSGNGTHSISAESVSVPLGYSLPDQMDTTPPLPDADTAGAGIHPPQSRSPALPLASPASLCPAPAQGQESGTVPLVSEDLPKDECSDLSDGDFQSEEEERGDQPSSDDSFEPYPEKRVPQKKSEQREARKPQEPRERKKPGPKPGWKKKIKCEREELPTIYKCHYQGCTAVYRGADGMKKHIKEHHEEVRERPCPHPGCNKVFMIDRYLQRHVKLIHTEERNYICDQCGQAFKQRKHLSVHQMRHSGAKPLQCEVCGFQCRQRASLKYHMTKHKAEAELEFACDQCGKRFEKAHNLNVHMSMVHPLTQSPAKPPETEPDIPSGTMGGQAMKPELTQLLPQ
ncbi:zinc finger protein 276 isoform X2 [Ascaphus truei]|uniref:zinc finger protein 276 isoform X2 n=1 Tax=Ascaphus truei TaxID=8439 RepID=UPI003F5ADBEF